MKSFVYRSHLLRRSMPLRCEHRPPSENSAKTRCPGLIGYAEPVMDKSLGYPSRPIQQGDKNMTNTTAANGKEAAYHGVPAEDDYGYAQAIKI